MNPGWDYVAPDVYRHRAGWAAMRHSGAWWAYGADGMRGPFRSVDEAFEAAEPPPVFAPPVVVAQPRNETPAEAMRRGSALGRRLFLLARRARYWMARGRSEQGAARRVRSETRCAWSEAQRAAELAARSIRGPE